MNIYGLTLRNARRSPTRVVLTVWAAALSLVAFILLRALSAGWTNRVEQTPNDRVVVRHRIGRAGFLPVHYAEEIRLLPGIERAMGATWMGLKLPGNDGTFFQSFAVGVDDFLDMHHELSAPAQQREAFRRNRRGAAISADLASEHGWRPGDVLHFKSRDYAGQWEVTLEALITSTRAGYGQRTVWLHWDYFNETLPVLQRDRLSLISARVIDSQEAARMARTIDIHFATRADATFSQTDKAANAASVSRYGALLEAMHLVSMLVLCIIVLILGNTIAMSTRERTREYGTLRVLGFMPRHLVVFILGEAATLGFSAGALSLIVGLPLVQGPFSRYVQEEMRVAALRVSTADAAAALALGLALGIAAAVVPALRVSRLEVTHSLSHLA